MSSLNVPRMRLREKHAVRNAKKIGRFQGDIRFKIQVGENFRRGAEGEIFSVSRLLAGIIIRSQDVWTCPWRIPNHPCQSAPPFGLIFPSTMLTLSGHEEYVHSFHLSCVPHQQTPQTWRHEGSDCRESHTEAATVTSHPLPKTRPRSFTPRSFPPGPLDHLSGSSPHQAGRHSRQTLHTPEVSSGADQIEISAFVLLTETRQAGSSGPFPATHCARTGNETPESEIWVPENCRADSQDLCPTSR